MLVPDRQVRRQFQCLVERWVRGFKMEMNPKQGVRLGF